MLQVLYQAEGRPQVFTLVGNEASIGRSSENDIVLNDFSVSRHHAFVRREGDGWVIYDNKYTNGLKVLPGWRRAWVTRLYWLDP